MEEYTAPSNFIHDFIDEDLEKGVYDRIQTRFPPEPNGYLHIGHAKAICIDFLTAKKYNGLCNLRLDDTNPTKEDVEYVDAIKEDIQWLGFQWNECLYASSYFDFVYECAVKLIEMGKAFVCDLTQDEMREYRGTLTEPGKESPYRNRSIEENLDLFKRMTDGEFPTVQEFSELKLIWLHPTSICATLLFTESLMFHIIRQVTNGVFIRCMTLLIRCQMPQKVLLTLSAHWNLKTTVLFMIGS